MGDRVAVIKDGYLQQVDSPQNLYDRPANVFVAAFIGSPSMNLYDATITIDGDHGSIALGSQTLTLAPESLAARPGLRGYHGKQVVVGIRPEDFEDVAMANGVRDGAIVRRDDPIARGPRLGDHGALRSGRRTSRVRRSRCGRGVRCARRGQRCRTVPPPLASPHRRHDRHRRGDREPALLRQHDAPRDLGVTRPFGGLGPFRPVGDRAMLPGGTRVTNFHRVSMTPGSGTHPTFLRGGEPHMHAPKRVVGALMVAGLLFTACGDDEESTTEATEAPAGTDAPAGGDSLLNGEIPCEQQYEGKTVTIMLAGPQQREQPEHHRRLRRRLPAARRVHRPRHRVGGHRPVRDRDQRSSRRWQRPRRDRLPAAGPAAPQPRRKGYLEAAPG